MDEPVVEAAPVVETPPAALTPEQQEDAALETLLEKGVDIPGDVDGRLVPLAAVTTLRSKVKDLKAELDSAKTGGDKAAQLEAQIADLNAKLAEAEPLANAYKAFSRVQEPPPPAGPTAEDIAELEELARDEDYYKTDGTLDTARAGRHRDRIRKEAAKIAQAQVAPYAEQQTTSASAQMLRNAKMTAAPDGSRPDPAILDELWGKLDPKLTSTKEGAIQVWRVAMGDSAAMGRLVKAQAAAARTELPVPLVIEKAGGRDPIAPQVSARDERAAKDLGMSVSDYMKELNDMPQGWGKSK